jgi:hypothetical protein
MAKENVQYQSTENRRNAQAVLHNLCLAMESTGKKILKLEDINLGRKRVGLNGYTPEEIEQIKVNIPTAIGYNWVRKIRDRYIVTSEGLAECHPDSRAVGVPIWEDSYLSCSVKRSDKRYKDTKAAAGAAPKRIF